MSSGVNSLAKSPLVESDGKQNDAAWKVPVTSSLISAEIPEIPGVSAHACEQEQSDKMKVAISEKEADMPTATRRRSFNEQY